MPELNQKGFAHLFLIILLVAGIGLTVWLVSQKTQLFPQAASNPIPNCSVSAPCPTIPPAEEGSASYLLFAPTTVAPNSSFILQLKVKSPTEAANTFLAKLSVDPSKLEVESIVMDSTIGSFVTQVDDVFFDNTTGEISLLGGLLDPGLKTALAQGNLMAQIKLKAKGLGQTTIKIEEGSQIISNDTNQNIASGNLTNVVVNIGSISASPSPSVSPSAVVSPSPSPSLSPSISPSPSAAPVACTLTSAKWVFFQNPMTKGNTSVARVDGTGGCVGKKVSFKVKEDDGVLGSENVATNPVDATFNSDNFATSVWITEFQEDGLNGFNNPPEYFFIASLLDNPQVTITSSGDQLKVNNLRQGQFLNGDGNKDGKIDILDLAVLRKWWGKTGFPQETDVNDDGVINTPDLSGLRKILETAGIIKTRN